MENFLSEDFNTGDVLLWSQHAIPKYSKGPMTAHLKDLPKQPLPSLKESLPIYLEAVKPLITPKEYQKTKKNVRKFLKKGGVGEKLYDILKEQYSSLDNWISDRWVRAQLQANREPITPRIAVSAHVWQLDFETQEQYLRFVSTFIYSIADFKRMIDCHEVKPDVMRGKLLDMSQYFLLFSTTQVPSKDCDRCCHYGDYTNYPRHITVARNNKFYQINVLNDDGLPIASEKILQQLQRILSQSEMGIPVGILTTEHRETWAHIHEILCQDEVNKHSIRILESSMFVLSLDKPVNYPVNKDKVNQNLCNFLHGCGPSANGCNRWFDCGLNIYITDDGAIGVNMGPCPLEAQPFQRMIDHSLFLATKILNEPSEEYKNGKTTTSVIQEPKELRFNLPAQVLKDIEKAKLKFQKACDNVDLEILEFHNFGRKFLRSQNITVDSFVQLAYQFTVYRLHGNKGKICSLATLHNFYRGNYELLQSTTTESLEFCKTMLNEKCSEKVKYITLTKALEKNTDNINKAMNGKGINYLLLGLKIAAEENDFEMPDMFRDTAFLKFFDVKLISSQVPGVTSLPVYSAYGPFSVDGYACPYFVYPDKIHFSAFSYKHIPETDSKKFLKLLNISLLEMEGLVRKYSDRTDKCKLKNHAKITYEN
ncbi:carnitine O-acetyltransferase-like [Centruroides vittatus]|uniref:carnitine O-acetyltransferase-like n=1 Tax=Centruroides vittatus TaxID=120091 RepID=UPI00350E8E8A